MKNIPMKKGLSIICPRDIAGRHHSGVLDVQGTDRYVKITSEIEYPPVKIMPTEDNEKQRIEDVLTCAKAYQVLKKEGLYHPDTQPVVCKDKEGYLALMIILPKLDTDFKNVDELTILEDMQAKFKRLEEKFGFKNIDYFWDLKFMENQGVTEKGRCYVHDIHITKFIVGDETERFEKTLKVARRIVESEKLTSE